MNLRFSHDPAQFPHSSSAFDGYLWKIRLDSETAVVTDLDELAHVEERNGLTVTILDVSPDPNC